MPQPVEPAGRGGRRRGLLISGLAALLLAVAGLGALLVVNTGSGDSDRAHTEDVGVIDTGPAAGGLDPTQEAGGSPPCDKAEAERQMSEGALAEAMRDEYGTTVDPSESFYSQLVACADLNGDETEEMVVQGLPPSSGGPTPWAILTPVGGGWDLLLARLSIPATSLSIENGAIHEVSVGYAVDDPLCCASYERSGVVAWDGRSFEYVPDEGSLERVISISSDGSPARLGELELSTADLGTAKSLWGPPTNVSPDGSVVCRASWADLGLRITFANFGAAGACGGAGRISFLDLEGGAAAQAGWEVPGGLRVGASMDGVLADYPDAYRDNFEESDEVNCSGDAYVLRTMPFIGEEAPSLLVYPDEGLVHCIRLSPYAAGE